MENGDGRGFKQRGFTLIELMIIVSIIGILAAVAIPKFAYMRAKSYKHTYGHWPEGWSDQREWEFTHGPNRMSNQDPLSPPGSDEIQYFKDDKTGLCFAKIGNSLTSVPCEKVHLR